MFSLKVMIGINVLAVVFGALSARTLKESNVGLILMTMLDMFLFGMSVPSMMTGTAGDVLYIVSPVFTGLASMLISLVMYAMGINDYKVKRNIKSHKASRPKMEKTIVSTKQTPEKGYKRA